MALDATKLEKLGKVFALHKDWLLYTLFGSKAISKEALKSLQTYGKLPLDKTINFIEKAYLLGRLRLLFSKKKFEEVSWEQLLAEELNQTSLTAMEKLAVQQARLHAGEQVKGIASAVEKDFFTELSRKMNQAISEAVVKDVIKEETALALVEKKTYRELSSNLAERLGDKWDKDWAMIARTEFHKAKVAGQAQALVNKVGIYSGSDGPDSKVSVLPGPNACSDCKKHYLDKSGNPKVFKLATLIAAGSNGDKGVSHVRGPDDTHSHWKTTLPPLHPRCGCNLTYIPPGFGWKDAKLIVVDSKAAKDGALKKSVDGVRDPRPTAVVPPSGPPQDAKPPSIPTMPGVPSVNQGNQPTTVKPPKLPPGVQDQTPKSPTLGHEGSPAAPKMPGATSPKAPGIPDPGASQSGGGQPATPQVPDYHHPDIVEQFRTGQLPPEGSPEHQQLVDHVHAVSKQLSKQDRPHDEIKFDLNHGDILHKQPLSGGINPDTFKVAISNGGHAVMKPPITHESMAQGVKEDYDKKYVGKKGDNGKTLGPIHPKVALRGTMTDRGGYHTAGMGTTPLGTSHKREVAAYGLSSLLGGAVPPTTTRHHEGQDYSLQHFNGTHVPFHIAASKNQDFNDTASMTVSPDGRGGDSARYGVALLRHYQNDPDMQKKVHGNLSDLTAMDIIMNNNDRHSGNLLVNLDEGSVVPIDHGTSFGEGMRGYYSDIHADLSDSGQHPKMTDEMSTKLKNMSLGDFKRSIGEHLEPHEVGQAFLRARYVQHLQDTEGHIDHKHFLPVDYHWNGKVAGHRGRPEHLTAAASLDPSEHPNAKFEQWAIQHLDTARNDPSHPDHEAAKELHELGVFHGPGALEPKAWRDMGKHREYEQSIREGTDFQQPSRKILQNRALDMEEDAGGSPSFEDQHTLFGQGPYLDLEDDDQDGTPTVPPPRKGSAQDDNPTIPPPSKAVSQSDDDDDYLDIPSALQAKITLPGRKRGQGPTAWEQPPAQKPKAPGILRRLFGKKS